MIAGSAGSGPAGGVVRPSRILEGFVAFYIDSAGMQASGVG